MTETRIITAKGTIEQRYGRMRLKIDLPPNLMKVAQVAITTKGLGKRTLLSNRVYYGLEAGTGEATGNSVINNIFPSQILSSNKCLKSRSQALDVWEDFGNDFVPRHPSLPHQFTKLFYAHPVRWGLAHFVINDKSGVREGGFMPPKLVTIYDEDTGARDKYFVYESINKGIIGIVNVAFAQPVKGLLLNKPESGSTTF